MKTKDENPKGLHMKYVIKKIIGWREVGTHVVSREPITIDVNPEFEGFILRLDNGQKDKNHLAACRIAVNAYADAIEKHIPELAKNIRERWPLGKPSHLCAKEGCERNSVCGDFCGAHCNCKS